MSARVCSAAVQGIKAYPVEVEANVGWGDPKFTLVGLPDAAVRASVNSAWARLMLSGFGRCSQSSLRPSSLIWLPRWLTRATLVQPVHLA